MRELGVVQYQKDTHSSANMLLNFGLMDQVTLNKNLTYMWGKDSDLFPLLTLTEGMNATTTKKAINAGDSQYKWPVATRMRHVSQVVRLLSVTSYPGLNYQTFEVEMVDNWFIYQHGAVSPDGEHMVRIQSEGVKTPAGTYIYRFQLSGGRADEYVPTSNFESGKYWASAAPSVAAAKSDGNRSNSMSHTEATNQFGYYRFSKQITGNIANKLCNIEFDLDGGGTTNYYIPYEMKLFEIDRKLQLEEELWYSEYNRDKNGVIHLNDPKTGEPIPRGAGIRDILRSVNNYDTFSKLTLAKIDNIFTRLYSNRVDNTPVEIVLYCGDGFFREFNAAIESDANAKQFFTKLGEESIMSGGDYLTYGRYFNQYRTIDNRIVTVKPVNLFNHGTRAEMDRKNGRMYKGLPVSSYTGVFLDHSRTDNGERNVKLVYEDGRENQVGVYKGLTKVPGVWGLVDDIQISSRIDEASYEVFTSQGINIDNPTTSFWLDLAL